MFLVNAYQTSQEVMDLPGELNQQGITIVVVTMGLKWRNKHTARSKFKMD
ncbi:MAG: hypothetical protein MUC48_14070 [Leptolyngbya sp. Prado105]|nr:hypothetical protein [Leptolyngbya sp. Prado105]